jgi:large subunit ribosomal protein L6
MSRVGKKVVEIPNGTTIEKKDGGLYVVKGPKGELQKTFDETVIDIAIDGTELRCNPKKETPFAKALWGTYVSHFLNMVQGVNTPYQKQLVVEGVGFKSEVRGSDLVMALGFSHEVVMPIPEGLTVTAEKNVITVTGIDKEKVGQFAADIRAKKKPEPYKGKGIRYQGEVIRRKQGKRSA